MARDLPDVTLVIIDTHASNLARRALHWTYEQIIPRRSLLYGSPPSKLVPDNAPAGVTLCPIPPLASIDDYNALLWYDVPQHVRTSHVLVIQYDGWVLNGQLWQDEWLNFDYIGAPWPWHRDGLNVGNGGFSLRSRRLLQYLTNSNRIFPVKNPEDDTLCREYREALEATGFQWGSLEDAKRFSFEREPKRPSFGFHGIFNWAEVLSLVNLRIQVELVTDYVRAKSEWKELEQRFQGPFAFGQLTLLDKGDSK